MATMQPLFVGVFTDRAQAGQAVNALLNAGFSNDQISYSGRGASAGGILDTLKSLFTGAETTTGSVYEDLVSRGVPQDDARYYQREYEAGRSIVAVQPDGQMQEASDIIARYGGYGTNTRSAQTAEYDDTPGTASQETYTEGTQHVELREEQLRVNKQTIQAGEVGIRKEVVTEQQTINVPVTHEEVVIERRPVSGQASDTPIGEGETYRIPVREEQVMVEKRPVVREEVSLGKRQVQETQQVSDTVKREEAYIERQGDVSVQGSNVIDEDR